MSRIIAINYANDGYKNAQKLNAETACAKGKVDEVILYSPGDLDKNFVQKNQNILSAARGNGYWLWKPYFVRKTLQQIEEGDYLLYMDAASVVLQDIHKLVSCMERDEQDLMSFCLPDINIEKKWTKRDAFILLGADTEEIVNSPQRMATFLLIKKTKKTMDFIDEYLYYAQDERIITDLPNVMGKENYPDWQENRHDQTIYSLLCKKYGFLPYRDPSQYGNGNGFAQKILNRSNYPQMFDLHRIGRADSIHRLFFLKRYMPIRNKWLRFYLGLKGWIGRRLGIIRD